MKWSAKSRAVSRFRVVMLETTPSCHQEGAPQHLETAFQQHLGADARHGWGHRPDEGHAGGEGGPDLVQHGGVLKPEHLREDDEVLVPEQNTDIRDGLFPVFVQHAGDVYRAHFARARPEVFHLRQAHEADPAGCAGLLQRFREERAIEVVEAGEIDDKRLFGDMFLREDGHVLQGQGNGLELAHGHELQSVDGVGAYAGRGEQGRNPFPDWCGLFETAGEKMHRILPGAYDGDFLACLLEADACGEARQASADDHSIESHTPNTCL